ncbi:MAG TPA: hypothetical protein VKA66_21980 [Mycobacterium sp.]|nr:hypothetical protein [Mycobacterium sp.]HKI42980.1 hypothetical protein [Mycobacterium sp.]
MIRGLVIGVAIAASAIGSAPIAIADDVPGMRDNAVLGAPCDNGKEFKYIYGHGPNGETLACVDDVWVESVPLVGVRQIGSSCSGSWAAQAPDGRPLICIVGLGFQPGP